MVATPPVRLAADPRLPQRDLLLDADAVARRLAARLGAGGPIAIERCERWRVKYRIGESLRVLYGVQARGRRYLVAARAFQGGRSADVYRRAAATELPCELLRPVIHDPDLDVVFWLFPNDRKIGNLAAFRRIPAVLAQLLARPWRASRLVAYAPEKSATARCLGANGETLAYAKIYAGDEGARAYEIYDALWHGLPTGDPHLGIPRLLGYLPAQRMLLLEPIAGRRIADLHGAQLQDALKRLGAALARLHSLPLPPAPRFERFDLERLRQAALLIGQSRADAARPAAELADELCARWQPSPEGLVCLHGDIHPKNGILVHDRMTLIDLDQAGAGPAAADLGGLLAGLRYSCRIGLCSRAAERALAGAFLAGYAAVRALPPPTELRWHAAAALLAERALRAVNRVRAEGLLHLDEILGDARALLK